MRHRRIGYHKIVVVSQEPQQTSNPKALRRPQQPLKPASRQYTHTSPRLIYHKWTLPTLKIHFSTLLSPVLHGWHRSGANLLLKCANSTTRALATTQHNSTSPPKPSPETYRHFTPRLLQHLHLYAPYHCFKRPINQPNAPACTVSAAATQGLTLTQSRYPPTSACPTQISFAEVHFCLGATGTNPNIPATYCYCLLYTSPSPRD